MGFFDKMKEPVFLKEDSSAKEQLEQLKLLLPEAPPDVKEKIEHEMRLLNAGIFGEENIAFELRNSHIPMFVLHDLYLKHGDLSAQIDYVIITKKRFFVIECKNLFGNLEINSNGDFIRTVSHNGKYMKEGIYSPITQNKRHLELIKQIKLEQKNFIHKAIIEKSFYDIHRSVVVLANPKTVLNAKFAKKDVKNQVIRADQLIEHIRKVNGEPGVIESSEKDMEQFAQSFLKLHQQNPTDYVDKYRKLVESRKEEAAEKTSVTLVATPSHLNKNAQEKIIATNEKNKGNEKREEKGESSLVCPQCGSIMVKRRAAKGNNAGNEFWGCSGFPKCRGIVNIK